MADAPKTNDTSKTEPTAPFTPPINAGSTPAAGFSIQAPKPQDKLSFYDPTDRVISTDTNIPTSSISDKPMGPTKPEGFTPDQISEASGVSKPQATQPPKTKEFTPASDQSKIFDSMNGGAKDGAIHSAGDAFSAFSSADSGLSGSTTLQEEIEGQIKALQTSASTPPPSLVETFNKLIADSGLSGDQAQLLNLKTIMSGTVDDIRTELTAKGGFATESQIQGLASQRNSWLQRQYDSIQNGLALKQQWVDNYMKYFSADVTNAQNAFDKKFQLQDTLLNTLERLRSTDATAFYRFQTSQFNKLKFMLDSGALGGASDDVLASYSASTGIPVDTLKQAASNTAAKEKLSLALLNANVAYKDARITPGGTLSSSRVQSFVAAGVPASVANEIYGYLQKGTDVDSIRSTLAGEYGKDKGSEYIDTFMPIFQSSSKKKYTGTTIPNDVQSQLMSDIGAGNFSVAQLINAYPDVDATYISALVTASAQ